MDESPPQQSTTSLPPELAALLRATDAASQERAWAGFLDVYSRLILHTARSLGSEYDAVMDRYVYAVDQLREDGFRRLRGYEADGRGKFTTWLTVVARRLCLDHHRHRYGRARATPEHASVEQETRSVRRRLVDLVAEEVDASGLSERPDSSPEAQFRRRDLTGALQAALACLAPRDRLLLALRFEDDLSAREITDVMGFPTPFHVYRRVNAVLASLRRTLEQRGVDDATP